MPHSILQSQNPKIIQMLEDEISSMNHHAQNSVKGHRAWAYDPNAGKEKDYIYVGTESTYPEWYAKAGVKNTKHLNTIVEAKKGAAYNRLKEIAHDRLVNGWHDPNHGYDDPNEEYLEHALKDGHITPEEYNQSMDRLINKTELEKNFKHAALGLGMIGALASPNLDRSGKEFPRQEQQQEVESPKPKVPAFGTQPEDHFLHNIKQVETSGGKNLNHPLITYGMHKGFKAMGNYALMPLTVKEMAKRHKMQGGNDPDVLAMEDMNPHDIPKHMASVPDLELKMARILANHVIKKHGNNTPNTAFAWKYGHNLPAKSINPEKRDQDVYIQKFKKLASGEKTQGLHPFVRDIASINKNEKIDLEKMSQPRLTFPKLGTDSRPDQQVQVVETPRQKKIYSKKAVQYHVKENDLNNKFSKPIVQDWKRKEEKRIASNLGSKNMGVNVGMQSATLGGKELSSFEKPSEETNNKIKEHSEAKNKIIRDYNKSVAEWREAAPSPLDKPAWHEHLNKRPEKPKLPRAPSKPKRSFDELSNEEKIARAKRIDMIKEHEGLHRTLKEVRNSHGNSAYEKLKSNLLRNFDTGTLNALYSHVAGKGYKTNSGHFDEELLTHARDILVDPKSRNYFKAKFKDPAEAERHIKNLKIGHKKAYQYAKSITPEMLKNEDIDLIKAPYLMDDEVSDKIGQGSIPFTSPKDKHVITNKLKNGLYHHVFDNNRGYNMHYLSSSQNPTNDRARIAYVGGMKKYNGTPEGSLEISMSKVKKEHAGKGHGKSLYLAALAHHGDIESDTNLTARSNNVWQSLEGLGNGHVKTDLAPVVTGVEDEGNSTHRAKADKNSLRSHLFAGQEEKLAANENIESDLTKGSLQSKMKFKPQHDISPEHRSAIRDWQRSDGEGREKIPEITGNARARALHVLSKRTQTRIHPETGEREFLLHRGMGQNEHELLQYNKGHKEKSSWTPDLEVANRFAKRYLIMDRDGHQDQDTAPTEKRRVSAWIPESSIHHYLPMVGTTNPDLRMSNLYSGEHEVIVKPHKLNTVQFSMQRTNPLHEKINRKVAKQQHGFTKLAANENIESDLAKGSLQSRLKYNANKISEEDAQKISDWQKNRGDRQSVPRLEENGRQRALNKLAGLTEVRKDPETGKRLFLLHRGMGEAEKGDSIQGNKHIMMDMKSWTPRHAIASRFAGRYENEGTGFSKPVSAWIHEDDIHSYLPQTGGVSDKGSFGTDIKYPNDYIAEHEVIVNHTKQAPLAKDFLVSPKTVHSQINSRFKQRVDKSKVKGKDLEAGISSEKLWDKEKHEPRLGNKVKRSKNPYTWTSADTKNEQDEKLAANEKDRPDLLKVE